ncbi:MAG: GYF domain-containing protein, partial [Verrucomicrobiia bacterium]
MGEEYFYINPGSKAAGPVSRAQLIEMARQGVVHEGTNVVEVNGTDWRPFEAIFGDGFLPEKMIALQSEQDFKAAGPELSRFVLLTALLMPPLGIPALVFLAQARTA